MLTINDCFKVNSLEQSAIFVANKVAFSQRAGYVISADELNYWESQPCSPQNINRLYQLLKSNRFVFDPCMAIQCRLKPNKIRNLYIPTWRDKIVDRWLYDCLNKSLRNWFSSHSYAYKVDEMGLDNCQHMIAKMMRCNGYYAKRDITNYFDSIDHEILLEKLTSIVDPNDYLYALLDQRIRYYFKGNGKIQRAIVGVPFGCSVACALANIYLTDLDKSMDQFDVKYFRYADDIMVLGKSSSIVDEASLHIDRHIENLKLAIKPSKMVNGSVADSDVKFLGLMFSDKDISLPIEKQRKIIRMVDRMIMATIPQLRKLPLDGAVKLCVAKVNELITSRFKSIAIIDYYLKHVTDEKQLREIDKLIAQKIISAVLGRKFKNGLFKVISFKNLREYGLISLVHRSRLHRHGHINIKFMSLLNTFFITRQEDKLAKRVDRLNQLRIIRKIKKHKPNII